MVELPHNPWAISVQIRTYRETSIRLLKTLRLVRLPVGHELAKFDEGVRFSHGAPFWRGCKYTADPEEVGPQGRNTLTLHHFTAPWCNW